ATLAAHVHIYESLARRLLDEGDARGAFVVLDALRARTLKEELQRESPGAADSPRVAELRKRLEALWRSLERREEGGEDLRRAEHALLGDVARCERDLVRALEEAETPLRATNGAATLPEDPCLAWSVVRGEVVGFLSEKGRVSSWPCGPLAPLREDLDRFRFQVTRRLHGGDDPAPALAALERLGRALLPPEPPSSTRLCAILPPEIGALPVEALLPEYTVSYAACASLAGRPKGVRGQALAIGLDAARLPEVGREVALVPRAEVIVDATRAEILDKVRGKALVHIAGHAEAREDLPLMSALRVADGWITAADFAGRRSRALFVLSACRTGDPSLLYRGEMLGGFPRSLLAAGCSGVIASRWEVRDAVAASWMGYFYEEVLRSPADVAAAAAARRVRERFPHPADWAAFLYLRGSTS
ncbi:MAG TPA: CHAT domain-containing protein, partial [Planctomycetota bacterium]|nr:CHAT domain-containing protein [Planctomycetota bacterium]